MDPNVLTRKIIHIDMDAFYASVQQRDRPELQGKPVVVGGDPQGRGVVASASYEARKFGIRSAMSCAQARRLCPSALFVFPSFEKYLETHRKLMQFFQEVTPLVEPLALDEAYLDVTGHQSTARDIALLLKNRISSELGLTASAGVGPNKFIAKLASEFRKPNGLVVVPPAKAFQFVAELPVEKFWGVGPATAKRLHSAGIKTASDVRKRSVSELEKWVGSYGSFLFELAHGEDNRPVDPSSDPKSRGTETTFKRNISDPHLLLDTLREQAKELSLDLKKMEHTGRTVTLKIKYSDFTSITRSQTLFHPTDKEETLYETASQLLFRDTEVQSRPVRLIGISVGNLINSEDPLQLWFDFYR